MYKMMIYVDYSLTTFYSVHYVGVPYFIEKRIHILIFQITKNFFELFESIELFELFES